jgi:hypothetical protein
MPPPKLEIKLYPLIDLAVPGALSARACAGDFLHLHEDLSSFHRVLEKPFQLLPLAVQPGPRRLHQTLEYGGNCGMTQTFNRVDHHHLCSLDEFSKAVLEYCGILVSTNCNANHNSTSFTTQISDRTRANDSVAADLFTARSILQ